MIEDIFYNTINEKTYGMYRQKAFSHSYRVSSLIQILAPLYELDPYLCKIIGLYHDIAQFINCNSFNHAKLSSEMTRSLLNDYIDSNQLDIICLAILNHSDKDHIHDPYSEVLKDADILADYYEYNDNVISPADYKRIEKYIKKGAF